MDTYKPKLVKFSKKDINQILLNLEELIDKIEVQLQKNLLTNQEQIFLKSNYEVLLKFRSELSKRYGLDIK